MALPSSSRPRCHTDINQPDRTASDNKHSSPVIGQLKPCNRTRQSTAFFSIDPIQNPRQATQSNTQPRERSELLTFSRPTSERQAATTRARATGNSPSSSSWILRSLPSTGIVWWPTAPGRGRKGGLIPASTRRWGRLGPIGRAGRSRSAASGRPPPPTKPELNPFTATHHLSSLDDR